MDGSTIYTFHVIGPVRNSFAHMLSSELLSGKGELRGTLAQGRDLARLLNSSIDLLEAGRTAFHINPDGRMPCEIESDAGRDEQPIEDPWREWAAKILAAYPWVDEFKPEDSDEKYRDGVRYVLLCIDSELNAAVSVALEMQDIKAKWGFS